MFSQIALAKPYYYTYTYKQPIIFVKSRIQGSARLHGLGLTIERALLLCPACEWSITSKLKNPLQNTVGYLHEILIRVNVIIIHCS